jgi:hypothetical protein
VVTSPADEWVVLLPQLIDRTVVSGRAGQLNRRLQAAKKKVLRGAEKLSDTEACEMFSLIVLANGGKEGATEFVVYQPTQSGQIMATVQKCTKGVHTYLTYEENGLTPSGPLSGAMLRLVKIAHKRAIERL